MSTTNKGHAEFRAYLEDCDKHAIVPDVGGAFHGGWKAGRASLAAKAPAAPTHAAQRDELLQAAIDFIGTLTGMTPPPIEVAPPEVFAPFYEFVDRVQAITGAAPKAGHVPEAGQKVAPLQQGEYLPLAVASAPDRIWLDLGFDPKETDADFSDLNTPTWSADNASGHGIEYVRADRAARGAAQASPAPVAEDAGNPCQNCAGNGKTRYRAILMPNQICSECDGSGKAAQPEGGAK